MGTGATLEQIEAAKLRIQTVHNLRPGHPMEGVLAIYADLLVPPDHRIIRADENHLTTELRTALRRVVPIARAAYRYDGQAMRAYLEKVDDNDFTVLADVLAEAKS